MSIYLVGVAIVHGLISSLSACVYPLIPITTAIFGAGRTGHWLEGLWLSSIYVAGMSITYVALGIMAALTGTVFGSYMGSPVVIVVFSALFFLLGLNFLDIVKLPLPNFGDHLKAKKTGKFLYPFILGVFSGFIAAPCTAPLFGAILIDIAKNAAMQHSLVPGIVQALAFSIGMGIPFLLIGGFALKLPKPGKWLKAVKYVGAVVLFTAALHYLEDIIGPYPPEKSKYTMALLGLILFAIFLVLSEPLEEKENMTLRQKFSVIFFLLISAFGLFLSTSLFATPTGKVRAHQHDSLQESTQKWYPDMTSALKAAKPGNLLFIDFRADWCTACGKMENDVFVSKEFEKLVIENNIILVRLDFTEVDTPEKEGLINKYNVPGFPTISITDYKGETAGQILGYKNKEDFLQKVSKIVKDYGVPDTGVK
jgi:thiol:disulfide interchange protein DsbD